jgi:sulfate adenylyltransferase subunit 1
MIRPAKRPWKTGKKADTFNGQSHNFIFKLNKMDILRFITAGSVDDGKSTLIGRLLFDSNSISLDVMEAVQRAGKTKEGGVDLALLTDGLRAEREQGITIDVAYKYFTTAKRKFIIADAPGHVQYTRNMVTGASNVNLAIILVDARQGIVEQTRRHSFLTSMLGIQHLVIAINKMDLVEYAQSVYDDIVKGYNEFAASLNARQIDFIPISAKLGDNIVEPSTKMPWYQGPSLLQLLENVPVSTIYNHDIARFPVQYIIRPQEDAFHDYRGYAGKVISGVMRKGDAVVVLPGGHSSTITRLEQFDKDMDEVYAPLPVVVHLADDIDISRGDMIVPASQMPVSSQDIEARVCWMDAKKLQPGGKFLLQHNTQVVKCVVKEIRYKLEISTFNKIEGIEEAGLNDICGVTIRTAVPVSYDSYHTNAANGVFILIDETSCNTVAAGMID